MPSAVIRPIRREDNETMASIIRRTLEEFGANHPGTVYYDATTDALFELFEAEPRGRYWVAEDDAGRILGGGGIYPTRGLPPDTCELVKLYLLPEARGRGLGKALLQQCHEEALRQGFQKIYLETMPELSIAVPLYERMGYNYLDGALGDSGHFGCAIHMIRDL